MTALLDSGGAGGGVVDTTTDTTDDTSTDDTSSSGSDSYEFDTSTDTLGTDSGVAENVDDDGGGVVVDDSDTDSGDSSPAGGAGMEETIERFAGAPDGSLEDATDEDLVDLGNAASDYQEGTASEEDVQDAFADATDDPDNEPANGLTSEVSIGDQTVPTAAILGLVVVAYVALGGD
jgi:hypothetical protein